MNNVSAQFQAPWNGFGQLDPHHRSMLNLPDSALHGNMADLLAEASYRMSAVSPSMGQQLNSTAAQEDLPPLDFADFPISQPAEQHYTGIFPIMDGQLLPQPQTSLPEFPPKNSQLLQPHTTSQALGESHSTPKIQHKMPVCLELTGSAFLTVFHNTNATRLFTCSVLHGPYSLCAYCRPQQPFSRSIKPL